MNADRAELVRHNGDCYPAALLFAKLLTLTDEELMRVMTFAMSETLQSGSGLVEAAGVHLAVAAKGQWQADEIFLDLLIGKTTINAILEDVAGKQIAQANEKATGKVQKGIIADSLAGNNGRKAVKDWVPNWLNFPFRGHTETPVETTSIGTQWQRVASAFEPPVDMA